MKEKLRELSEICWAWNYVNPFFYATVVLLFLYVIMEFLVKGFWRYTGLYDYFTFKKYLKLWDAETIRWQYKRLHEKRWDDMITPAKIRRYKRLMLKERYSRIKRAK